MPSETQANKADIGEHEVAYYNVPIKQGSLQDNFARAPKEKILPPRGTVNMRFRDKIKVLKTGKHSGAVVSGQPSARRSTVRSVPMGSSKPWPGRKAAGVDELVRHMSNVPAYLRQTERADNLQETALNFGVLEWGLLERWAYQQKHSTAGTRGVSSSNDDESLLLSMRDDHQNSCVSSRQPHFPEILSDSTTLFSDFPRGYHGIGRDGLKNELQQSGNDDLPAISHRSSNCFAVSTNDEWTGDRPLNNDCAVCMRLESSSCNKGREEERKPSRFACRFPNDASGAPPRQNITDHTTEAVGEIAKNNLILGSTTNKFSRESESNPCSDEFNTAKSGSNSNGKSDALRMSDPLVKARNHFKPPRLVDTCEEHGRLSRQALLQLAWKKGLPLFMLSSGDSDILAATVRHKLVFDKDDPDSLYTIFTVQEAKRKSGTWIRRGTKNKKHHLVSNIVAEIRVSSSKSRCYNSRSHSALRQFVLVASEHGPAGPQFNTELAAIVTNFPQPMTVFSGGSETANSAVVVLIPSGIHGLSTSGENPLPLIERWKSDRTCDCGGWDEGCMLTVLTDDSRVLPTSTDDTRQFKLFAQGRSRDDGHAFSMVSFKEGLYAVEFKGSIALLQAFAICIAMLHPNSSSPAKPGVEVGGSKEHSAVADHEQKHLARVESRAPTSYVPYHPPLSPVGRA